MSAEGQALPGFIGNKYHKRRILELRNFANKKSFTAKYRIHKLGYYHTFSSIKEAIKREKQLKAGSSQQIIDLIN